MRPLQADLPTLVRRDADTIHLGRPDLVIDAVCQVVAAVRSGGRIDWPRGARKSRLTLEREVVPHDTAFID
jgi:hypothetical protein